MLDIFGRSAHHERMTELTVNTRKSDLLTGRQAAELLDGVTYTTLMRWGREGKVPSIQYVDGGKRLFRRSDIEALKTRTEVSASLSLTPDTSTELPGQERLPV